MMATTVTLNYGLIASRTYSGPLVSGLTPEGVTVLAANYLGNYQNFLALAVQYVDKAVIKASYGAPEGERLEIQIPGLTGSAYRLAQAMQQQYQQGKITVGGEVVAAWPEYPGQIAFIDGQDTLIMRWVKAQWQFVYVLIGILVVVGLYYIYQQMNGSNYSMYRATAPSGTPVQGVGVPSASGIVGWVLSHIPEDLLILGGLVALPFGIREVAKIKESRNELKAADRGYYPGEGD